ncbi:DUF538 domain-containing protein, partial [Escherichia coli]|nr:DUF538 domain-containing protein [Escherichia coli]
KLVSYAPEVTAYVEFGKIKKLTGVKAKELLLWVTLNEICLEDPPTGKLTFKTPTGLFRTFPVSAFEIEEQEVNNDVKGKMEVKEAAGAVEVKEV